MPDYLNALRAEIDEIDSQLLILLCKRFGVSIRIGMHKKSCDLPVFVPEREELLLNKLSKSPECTFPEEIKSVYTEIFKISRRLQQNLPDTE